MIKWKKEYDFIDVTVDCEQCGKKFTYEGKVYKNTGIPIRLKTVCDECKARNVSAYMKGKKK